MYGHVEPLSCRWKQSICNPGLPLGSKLVPSFFEHNMRILYYSDVLCIHINRFEIKEQSKRRQRSGDDKEESKVANHDWVDQQACSPCYSQSFYNGPKMCLFSAFCKY